jgi:hypothetical protein
METLIGFAAWLVPAAVMVLYLVSLYRRLEVRTEHLVATDLFLFPFGFLLLTFFSMGGAYAIGPSVRTPTIVFWLALVVAWVGLHALRWKPVLRLASVSLFIGISALLGFVAYVHVLSDADKVWWAAQSTSRRSACVSNLTEVGKAMLLYADSNDDRLPSANWTDALAEYSNAEVFHCPNSGYAFSYTMNSEALGIRTYEASPWLVVAFDGFGGENQTSAGPAELRWAHVKGWSAVVLTVDGRAMPMGSHRLFNYIWDRETALSPDWESWLKNFEGRYMGPYPPLIMVPRNFVDFRVL